MSSNIIIETPRTLLQQYTTDDVDNLYRIFSDPIAMTHWPATKTREEVVQWIQWNLESYKENGYGLYSVFRKTDLAFLGYCGFILQREVDGIDEVEIGYALVRQYWGKGYATETASACKKYGFNHLNCSRLISLVKPENFPSRKVAERNGMHVEKKIIHWEEPFLVYVVEKNT